jgi:predicted TIM-barrel fold metal-dependent hydrolase
MSTERIISADSHVNIRPEAVLEHLPAALHDDFNDARMAYGRAMFEQKPHKRRRQAADQDMEEAAAAFPVDAPWEAAGRPGAHDPHERLKDMDIDGVDAEVLYTDIGAGAAFYDMPDDGWKDAFHAFNSAAIEFASVDPDRLLPVYLVPIADIAEAVKEVHRLAGEGARAVHLPLYPTEIGFAPYWDPVYDPLWAALSETGIPISQHVGTNTYLNTIMAADPTPAKGIFQSLPPIFMAEVVGSWIVPGTFVRFPDLRVVLVEAGLGWIPYYLGRLDLMNERHGWREHYDMLPEPPSHYWRQNMVATFEEDEFGVGVRHEIGVETLMWATDYPHPDSTWPHSQDVISTHFADVPIEEARLMVGGNAARIYGL